MKKGRMGEDAPQSKIGPSLVCLQPEEESDLGCFKAPLSVAARSVSFVDKHVEEILAAWHSRWEHPLPAYERDDMDLVCHRCCRLDLHKKVIVACLIVVQANGQKQKEVRTFRTITAELLQLLDWLTAAECTHVAMESTGCTCLPQCYERRARLGWIHALRAKTKWLGARYISHLRRLNWPTTSSGAPFFTYPNRIVRASWQNDST